MIYKGTSYIDLVNLESDYTRKILTGKIQAMDMAFLELEILQFSADEVERGEMRFLYVDILGNLTTLHRHVAFTKTAEVATVELTVPCYDIAATFEVYERRTEVTIFQGWISAAEFDIANGRAVIQQQWMFGTEFHVGFEPAVYKFAVAVEFENSGIIYLLSRPEGNILENYRIPVVLVFWLNPVQSFADFHDGPLVRVADICGSSGGKNRIHVFYEFFELDDRWLLFCFHVM